MGKAEVALKHVSSCTGHVLVDMEICDEAVSGANQVHCAAKQENWKEVWTARIVLPDGSQVISQNRAAQGVTYLVSASLVESGLWLGMDGSEALKHFSKPELCFSVAPNQSHIFSEGIPSASRCRR